MVKDVTYRMDDHKNKQDKKKKIDEELFGHFMRRQKLEDMTVIEKISGKKRNRRRQRE